MALQFIREGEERMVHVILGVTQRTARRFIKAIKAEDYSVIRHGNLSRRRYSESFQVARWMLEEGESGERLNVELFRRWLAENGLDVPSSRTVRHWLLVEFGRRWRKRRKRKPRK